MSADCGSRARFGRTIGRGLIRHCPNCGQGRLFRRWFRMVDRCPRCGHQFDREEGFWLGAYVINFAVTEGALGVEQVRDHPGPCVRRGAYDSRSRICMTQ